VRIAVDARELTGKPTGVGRYLAGIIGAWNGLAAAAAHEIVFCAPQPVPLPGHGTLRASLRTASGQGTRWEQFVLPRLVADADVVFAPGYSGPLRTAIPMVVTVHDVSFAAHPEWFSWREGTRRRLLTRLSARRAARVITVSDFSKREIVRHLGIPAAKVDVIYSGVTAWTTDPERARPSRPLVLFVGSLFNRRHIPELIEAFTRVLRTRPDARLDIVGDNRTRPHVDVDALIARADAGGAIRARSYVSDDELAALYRCAAVFVFPSDYEGFALTPLEALAAGVPVVLLDTEVAREIYGPAAVYVERPDPSSIASALEHLLDSEAERQRLLAAAQAQLQRYSWKECGQRTLQVLLSSARRVTAAAP
jgi:glycosyltransferase involved in cell wall biosynthesis